MDELEKKSILEHYNKFSDEALMEAALSPREDYQEGVYDLILEICKNRGLEEKINRVKNRIKKDKEEKELIDSVGPYNFFTISAIQSKIKDLSDEELIAVQSQEKEERVQEIIQEEFHKRGIEEHFSLKKENSQNQIKKFESIQVLKDSLWFLRENSNIFKLALIIAVFQMLIKIETDITFLQIIPIIMYPFFSGLIIKFVKEIKNGDHSWNATIKFVLNKYIFLLTAGIIYMLLMIGGFIFLIIPGIFIGIKMMFYNQVILFEGKGLYDSLKRSWEITNGYFWSLLIIFIAIITPGLLAIRLEPMFPYSNAIIIMALINAFLLIWTNTLITITYVELISNNLSEDIAEK